MAERSPDLATLEQLCTQLGLTSEHLDELVHDAASQVASDVNNEGLDSQLAYLVEAWGVEETRRVLEDLER